MHFGMGGQAENELEGTKQKQKNYNNKELKCRRR